MAAPTKVFVIGVGMTKFEKPGKRDDFDYPDMAKESVTKALEDAGLTYKDIQQACVGYSYGDTTCGQRALYPLGMTGIPIYNVNNACATGSSALFLAKQLIEGGLADCVLAVGFEKMQSGSLSSQYTDRTNPMDRHLDTMMEKYDLEPSPVTAQMFGNAGREHMEKFGTKPEHFAKIAYKNHKHSVNNPYAQFRKEYSMEEILSSPMVHSPLTKLQCCPTSDGSGACILASEKFVRQHGLENRAVEVLGMEMTTDLPSTFSEKSCMKVVGYDMTKLAADKLYAKTGCRPSDVDVVELHDCFSCNELISYEALGLCAPGKAGEFIDKGLNTYGGQVVVNPSGGLISKGHPLGATVLLDWVIKGGGAHPSLLLGQGSGLAQCSELVWQLRGQAGKRQVKNARLALQHNIGLGGAAVLALYKKMGADNKDKSSGATVESKFISYPAFQEIRKVLEEDGGKIVKKVKGVICFKVTKGPDGAEGVWYVDAKNGNGSVKFGGKEKADVTITVADDDLLKMMTGQLDTVKAFFQKKLKVSGNMGLAMKVKEFQKPVPKAKL